MTHNSNAKKYRSYNNSKMMILDNLMTQPAMNYQDQKYKALLNDLQAGILKHQNKNHTVYLFLRFKKQEGIKKWIASFAEKITTAKIQMSNKPDQIVTFSLTNTGYDFLELPIQIRPAGEAFQGEMNKRLQFGENKVNAQFSESQNIHGIIMIASDAELTKTTLDDEVILDDKLITTLLDDKEKVLEILFHQLGSKASVPFGKSPFKDGFTNPKFFPAAFSSAKSSPVKREGLPNLDLALAIDKGGNSDAPCGSFGAFARFEFNQTAINKTTAEIKKITDSNDDLAEAMLIGRFYDGTSLTLSDKAAGIAHDDFDFNEMIKAADADHLQNDADASRCPFHTHARKSNPRTNESSTRKILRRGVYYHENNQQQGLLFVAYQNSLENQFEYIVKNWIVSKLVETDQQYPADYFKDSNDPEGYVANKENYKKIYMRSRPDIIFAPKGSTYEIPEKWNHSKTSKVTIEIERQLVDFEGGVYFFTPSISFLKKIQHFPKYSPTGKIANSKKVGIKGVSYDPAKEKARRKVEFLPNTVMHLANKEEVKAMKNTLEPLNSPYISRDKQIFEYCLKQTFVPEDAIKS